MLILNFSFTVLEYHHAKSEVTISNYPIITAVCIFILSKSRDTEGTRPLKEEYRKELVGLLRQGLIEDLDPQLLLDTEKRA